MPKCNAAHILRRSGLLVSASAEPDIGGVREDSRRIQTGDAWVLNRPRTPQDAIAFARDACARGAACVVAVESDAAALPRDLGVAVLVVRDAAAAARALVYALYGEWIRQVQWVGVTGTNGKTSLAWLVAQMWPGASAYVGTLGLYARGRLVYALDNTTPRLSDFIPDLAVALGDPTQALVAVEVSSIGIAQQRLADMPWTVRVLTNLTRDHLDFHGTIEQYHLTKLQWFDGDALVRWCERDTLPRVQSSVSTYSEDDVAGVSLRDMPRYMRRNLAGARAVVRSLGQQPREAVTMPPGRMELVPVRGIRAYVDYAHTPDALRDVLTGIELAAGARLIAVVGAGGDRDSGKRPLMARAAIELSHTVIFTSDNPRSEDPDKILDAMLSVFDDPDPVVPRFAALGVGLECYRIVDRAAAIRYAVSLARAGDVLVVAGKGHEQYQDVMGVKHPFSDHDVLRSLA